jgi:hypothetical protein
VEQKVQQFHHFSYFLSTVFKIKDEENRRNNENVMTFASTLNTLNQKSRRAARQLEFFPSKVGFFNRMYPLCLAPRTRQNCPGHHLSRARSCIRFDLRQDMLRQIEFLNLKKTQSTWRWQTFVLISI